jgi:AraC-like DNA-binding protein
VENQAENLTVAEVAQLMGYSRRTIIRLFEREPGVLIRPGKPPHTSDTSGRIPAGSAEANYALVEVLPS